MKKYIFVLLSLAIIILVGCSNDLSRNKAENIIEKSPAEFRKKILLHNNGFELGLQHDLWHKKNTYIGYDTVLSERGSIFFEDMNRSYVTLKSPLDIKVEVSGIADAVLPFTDTKGIKEVQFSWHYQNISAPIKWIISNGGKGKAYFRHYDDGWRLEGFDDIEYNGSSVQLSKKEEKEKQSDREKISKEREEKRRIELAKKMKEEEIRRQEQERLSRLIRKSKIPSKTLGTFKCINTTIVMGEKPRANGTAVLTDVDASYVHHFTNAWGNITSKVNVNFWFGNIKRISKHDSGIYSVYFDLKNTIRIGPGHNAFAIHFQDRQIRDNFYYQIIKAKRAWDLKYPELK